MTYTLSDDHADGHDASQNGKIKTREMLGYLGAVLVCMRSYVLVYAF